MVMAMVPSSPFGLFGVGLLFLGVFTFVSAGKVREPHSEPAERQTANRLMLISIEDQEFLERLPACALSNSGGTEEDEKTFAHAHSYRMVMDKVDIKEDQGGAPRCRSEVLLRLQTGSPSIIGQTAAGGALWRPFT